MKRIPFANGLVCVEDLGFTLMHDHLIFDYQENFKSLEIDYIRGKLAAYQSAGGKTIVDLTPHRRIDWVLEMCHGFDLNIILSTGYYLDIEMVCGFMKGKLRKLLPKGALTNTVEQNSERMIHEITEGIGGTDIKAGIIKVASDKPVLTPFEVNTFTAAAIASVKTKTPIAIHSCTGQLAQWEVLSKAGADPSRIFFSHVEEEYGWEGRDINQQLDHLIWLLKKGCYLQFNNFGFYFNTPKEDLLFLLRCLADKGYLKQIFISMDCFWEIDDNGRIWHDGEKLHPEVYIRDYTYIIKYAIPLLKEEAGFTQTEIDTIFVENPKRFFNWE